jgi:fibronectin-binding autotransporter adhesin
MSVSNGHTQKPKSSIRLKKKYLAEALIAAQLLVYSVYSSPAAAGQLSVTAFDTYNAANATSIVAGPDALYEVSLDEVQPTQMNVGFAEVENKAAAFNLLSTPAELQAYLLTAIEPAVIGPGGVLYITNGHHTFTALADSLWGSTNPTVFVNIIANYSNLTTAQFYAQMQASNLLLPLNDGVPETVNLATGAPIPSSFVTLTDDVYRGLEYSILKNNSSKIFTTTTNILGATGASVPGTDKETGEYSDFVNAEAYRNANGGLGLPYLSLADIALATQWQLNASSQTTMPGVGSITAAQLPGFILSQNLVNSGGISNATMAGGAMDGNGNFDGLSDVNLGTASNPIMDGTPNVGFVMELGNDRNYTVTLEGTNTYTGGTTITAGDLIISSDASLGAAPAAGYTINPNDVQGSVQAANGILFNSLSEGNGTLTIGTTSGEYSSSNPFSTSRPIAVDGETAILNVNGSDVNLNGPLVSMGTFDTGIGNQSGVSDLTIDSFTPANGSTKASATSGNLTLSVDSPYFYGNIIIGDTGTPTVTVMSDQALGATTGPLIGEVELNGGTLQTGAAITAPERDIFLGGGSTLDVDGYNSTWGTLSNTQRTLTIQNSNQTTAGSITFSAMDISATALLQLMGGASTDTAGESIYFTNGIARTGNDTLILGPDTATSLGTTSKVFTGQSSPTINGIAPAWMVVDPADSKLEKGEYSFLAYTSNGYVAATSTNDAGNYATTLSASTGSDLVNVSSSPATATGNLAAFALEFSAKETLNLGGHTLTLGDNTDPAGLSLFSGSTISNGTLAFGNSEGVMWLGGSNIADSAGSLGAPSTTISAAITGANGLTFAGSGGVAISAVASVTGPITIDSGEVTLSATNVFTSDVSGILLDDNKSKPSPAMLNIAANNQLASLNSVGNNSEIGIASGVTLTLGDTTNNLSSTISSQIYYGSSSASATPVLALDGSGLFDFSGGSSKAFDLPTGSAIVVNNSALFRVVANEFANAGIDVVLNGTSQLQFVENGGDVFNGTVSGTGALHLMRGALQITSASNTYSGGTILETGSTLDITTANLPSANPNITSAGGTVLFDQSTSGTYAGVISNGEEMGTGPVLAGSLIKDDSTGANSGNVTLSQQQTFTGATYVEAGTLTLGAVDTLASSSGVTLGRVGGCVATGDVSCSAGTTPTATLALSADNTLQGLASDADNTTAVTLGGNTLTIDPTATSGMVFGGVISGTGAVVIDSGAGMQIFSGSNTYSGGTTIDAGGNLGITSSAALGTGGLALAGTSSTPATLTVAGTTTLTNPVSIAGESAVSVAPGITTTIASAITDGASSGELLVQNTGLLDLSGINTYSGLTRIASNATLALSGSGSIASSSGVVDNGDFDISQTTRGATISNLSGSGVVALGGQTLTISNGSGSFSGTLADGGIVSTATGGSVVLAGGTTTLTGANTYTGTTTVNSGATLDLSGAGSIASVAGVSDSGTITISSANAVGGTVTINAGGVLALTGAGSLASSASLVDNGLFNMAGASGAITLTGLSGGGVLNLGANDLNVSNDTFTGTLQGTGSIDFVGGSNTISSGSTVTGQAVEIGTGATLNVTGTGSLADASSVTLASNATLNLTGATVPVLVASLGSSSSSATVNLGTNDLVVTDGRSTTAYSGTIIGTGSLTVQGGTQVLTGDNTFSGGITVDGGATLQIDSGAALGTGTLTLVSSSQPATLAITATTSINNNITVSGDPVFNVAVGTTTTINSVIANGSSPGVVDVAGTGVLALTAANTYTGATTINPNAYLALKGSGSIADSSIVEDNGTFDISSTSAGASITDLSGSGTVYLGDQDLSITHGASTFSGVIADGSTQDLNLGAVGGQLSILGGKVTLSGVNTYTGDTAISAGTTLALAGGGSISHSASVIDDGTFDISQTTSGTSITDLDGTGTVALGSSTLSITDGSSSFSGVIADDGIAGGSGGSLTVAGGTVTLSGANTYTGTTTINSHATLALTGTGSIAASAAVVNNGSFDISGSSSAVSVKSYTQGASGTLVESIAPGTNVPLNVTGTASLGGTLTLDPVAGAYKIGQYDLLTAGSLKGQFATVNLSAAALAPLGYSIAYANNDVILYVTPNSSLTQASINRVATGISAISGLSMGALSSSLGYDCSDFGAHGMCVSAGLDSAKESTGRMNDTYVSIGFALSPQWRAGLFGDQQLGSAQVDGVKLSARRPLVGGFVGWDANQDGTGLGIQASVATNASALDIARMGSSYSETATGNTTALGNAQQVKATYVLPLTDMFSVTPYAGLRLSELHIDGYNESGASYPVSYNSVKQRTLDALLGTSLDIKLTDRLSASLSASVTQNLSYQSGSVSGSSTVAGLNSFNVALPGSHYTSWGFGAGLGMALTNTQHLNLGLSFQQQKLSPFGIGAVTLSYSAGF